MMRRDLDRRRRHQPHPLALVEVDLGQGAGAGPDPVGHRLVEDLLAELLELGGGVPGDERQRGVARVGHVLGVLDADDPEVGLLPRGGGDLPRGEELAAVQPAREVEDAGALHDGVVDVEEGRRGRVAGPDEGVLDLRRRRRGLAREGRALLQVEAPGSLGRGHPASVAACARRRQAVEGSPHAAHTTSPRWWPRLPTTCPTGRPSSRAAAARSPGPGSRTRSPASRPVSAPTASAPASA